MQRAALAFLDHPSRGVAVLDAVAEMIERAGLHIGPRLPPAVALPTTLGILREALNRWSGLGLIRRRRGDGIYLTGMAQTSQGMRPSRVLLEGAATTRLPDMHRVIESPVRRAARNSIIDRVETEIRQFIAGGPIKGGMP